MSESVRKWGFAGAIRQNFVLALLAGFLVFTTLWLRLVNLGYSDYQGDEIRAMWRPESGQSALSFLYAQGRGPAQYLLAYLVKVIDPAYASQLLTRLPYTLAGILAVFIFYKLARLHFGRKIAIFATFFLATNGVLIGLMRIVQYQPLVLLFAILALYFFSLALFDETWQRMGIYAGMLSGSLALYCHSDGAFIAPFAIYLLYRWYRRWDNLPTATRWKTLAVPAVLCALLVAAYYVPYLLSTPPGIQSYWLERVVGEEETLLLPSSIYTFQLYNPILGLPVYVVLCALALTRLKAALPILAWLAFPWVVLELVISDPGTHIYNYLVPATLLAGLGVQVLQDWLIRLTGEKWGSRLNIIWTLGLFASLAAISHLILVDHTPEYPLEQRRILFWTIGGEHDVYQQWNYGFPYYRRWEDIRDFLDRQEYDGFIASNEKVSIVSFYLPYPNNLDRAGYYIYIYTPQNFRVVDRRPKVRYWLKHHAPDKVYDNKGRVVAEIYHMPSGDLEKIKSAGY